MKKIEAIVRHHKLEEVKDALSYLRVAMNRSDAVSFGRIVNTPRRGVGSGALEKLAGLALHPLCMEEMAGRVVGDSERVCRGSRIRCVEPLAHEERGNIDDTRRKRFCVCIRFQELPVL